MNGKRFAKNRLSRCHHSICTAAVNNSNFTAFTNPFIMRYRSKSCHFNLFLLSVKYRWFVAASHNKNNHLTINNLNTNRMHSHWITQGSRATSSHQRAKPHNIQSNSNAYPSIAHIVLALYAANVYRMLAQDYVVP